MPEPKPGTEGNRRRAAACAKPPKKTRRRAAFEPKHALVRELREAALEKWTYKRNGAVEGPVGTDQLAALYAAGEITGQTLVRSTTAGGGWRRYADIFKVRLNGAGRQFPRAVTKLWPVFALGAPILGGVIDVLLMRSEGNAYIASNPWLGHAPIILNITALVLWLALIWREIKRADRRYTLAEMIVWFVAAPVFQAFSWWATALVATAINLFSGFDMPRCDADVVQAIVRAQFDRMEARQGRTGLVAVALTGIDQQWGGDRFRMCTGKLESGAHTFNVRYKVEDRGTWLFRNTLHGLDVKMTVE
jgi:hypothetical protein